jgi:hypothetical protein
LASSLGSGETEAIFLAEEIGADVFVCDDAAARAAAKRRGLPTTGTLGILRIARHDGLIQAVLPLALELRRLGQYLDAQNPSNRDRLLGMDTTAFIATMTRWRALNIAGGRTFVAPGLTEDQIRGISVPAIIVPGDDAAHSVAVAERLHGLLAHSTLEHETVGPMSEEVASRLAPRFIAYLDQLQ